MDYVAAKEFKTTNRRFKAGDVVCEADIDSRLTFDQWKERGFIVSRDSVGNRAVPSRQAAVVPAPAEKKNDE